MISGVGVLISLSFAITIRCGIIYLMARKAKVVEIEEKLKIFGGISIVSGKFQSLKKDILKISPTTIILNFLPIMFTLGWTILLCYSIVKLL